ncbi:PREDICTED: AT-rich interactive domain-containing protein 4B-like [Priapulus caudatus]|uniref:AT-rich interactive domain-containing protein 4B-like n=1 Tax=Priapulus caudatus TaxID=37621 RepID=A0ABM1EMJ7_PRICU|nr:PREDICTED: AT-rich interactive domain-containing protein 4B-like [Priapulus caudatus]
MAGLSHDPPFLSVGTEVSAKYRGAFCEAKVKKVQRLVKCKVQPTEAGTSFIVTDDAVKGNLMVGSRVEVKHAETNRYVEATIQRLTDCSQYTVVFDDGDETTLRRSLLCLKGDKHFHKSETLDELPLTDPERFGTPVINKKSRKRRRFGGSASSSEESSDDEGPPQKKIVLQPRYIKDMGKVVVVNVDDKRRNYTWFPALVVSPAVTAEGANLDMKTQWIVRSFKDGKYHTVEKKKTKEFSKDFLKKDDSSGMKQAIDKALVYMERKDLPPNWDIRELLSKGGDDDASTSESSGDESFYNSPSEEEDRFVAQLYKFMDERGTPINKPPVLTGRDLNLFKVFRIVYGRFGGYNKVTNQSKWKKVHKRLKLQPSTPGSLSSLKSAYKRYLHSFEDFYRKLGSTMGSTGRPCRARESSGRGIGLGRDLMSPAARSKVKAKEAAACEEKTPTKDTKAQEAEASRTAEKMKSKDAETESSKKDEKEMEKATAAKGKETAQASKSKEEKVTPKGKEEREKPTPRGREDKPKRETKVKEEKSKPTKEKAKAVVKEEEVEELTPRRRGRNRLSSLCKSETQTDAKKEEPAAEKETGRRKDDSRQGGAGDNRRSGEKATRRLSTKAAGEATDNDREALEAPSGGSSSQGYSIGERVNIRYGHGENQSVYEAKVVEIGEEHGDRTYMVHYQGWNFRYDEWVKASRIVNSAEHSGRKRKKNPPGPNHKSRKGGPASQMAAATTSRQQMKRGRPPSSLSLQAKPASPASSTRDRSVTPSSLHERSVTPSGGSAGNKDRATAHAVCRATRQNSTGDLATGLNVGVVRPRKATRTSGISNTSSSYDNDADEEAGAEGDSQENSPEVAAPKRSVRSPASSAAAAAAKEASASSSPVVEEKPAPAAEEGKSDDEEKPTRRKEGSRGIVERKSRESRAAERRPAKEEPAKEEKEGVKEEEEEREEEEVEREKPAENVSERKPVERERERERTPILEALAAVGARARDAEEAAGKAATAAREAPVRPSAAPHAAADEPAERKVVAEVAQMTETEEVASPEKPNEGKPGKGREKPARGGGDVTAERTPKRGKFSVAAATREGEAGAGKPPSKTRPKDAEQEAPPEGAPAAPQPAEAPPFKEEYTISDEIERIVEQSMKESLAREMATAAVATATTALPSPAPKEEKKGEGATEKDSKRAGKPPAQKKETAAARGGAAAFAGKRTSSRSEGAPPTKGNAIASPYDFPDSTSDASEAGEEVPSSTTTTGEVSGERPRAKPREKKTPQRKQREEKAAAEVKVTASARRKRGRAGGEKSPERGADAASPGVATTTEARTDVDDVAAATAGGRSKVANEFLVVVPTAIVQEGKMETPATATMTQKLAAHQVSPAPHARPDSGALSDGSSCERAAAAGQPSSSKEQERQRSLLDNTPPTTPEYSPAREAMEISSCDRSLSSIDVDSSGNSSPEHMGGTCRVDASSTSDSISSIDVASATKQQQVAEAEPPSRKRRQRRGTSMSKAAKPKPKPGGGTDSEDGMAEDNSQSSSQPDVGSPSQDPRHKLPIVPPPDRQPKWNFCAIDSSLEGEERINFLQEQLQELRRVYMSLKSEVACIDRRRKRLRKKEREASASTSQMQMPVTVETT